jgi:hypothetical protein
MRSRLACHKQSLKDCFDEDYRSSQVKRKTLAHNSEQDGKHDESHQLDRLSAPPIDEAEANPVARDEASYGKNQVSDTDIFEVLKDTSGAFGYGCAETDCLQDDSRIQSEPVKGDLGITGSWLETGRE